jgi:hypothetical protein
MASETINTQNENNKSGTGKLNKGSRIFYVDPNDVYGTSNNIPLTPDYTDLCVSFDLQVETVPRTGYVTGKKDESENLGKDVAETYHFFWNSYQANSNPQDNYVSFTRGEDYLDRSYLTTYYTDINFNDFRRKDIVEGLGVESVSIAFENYYMPTIKMRFIDVRGASLFGREEATHVDNQITQDSIWGCFFTFPYPKFRLQVKGFFGHPLTYQLTCLDFRANFDSKTGNFVIDVTFVGYDYGIMSDIPTAYLMAAPYSRYVGMDYWNTQCDTNPNWRLTDGNPPKKLVEIRDNIKTEVRTAQKTKEGITINDGSNGADDADIIHELNELRGVKEAYNAIINYLFTINNSSQTSIIFSLYKFKYLNNEYYMFQRLNNEIWRRIVELTAAFYEKLEEYKNNYPYRGTLFDNKVSKQLIFGRAITKDESVGSVNGEPKSFPCDETMANISPITNLTKDNILGIFATKAITNIQTCEKGSKTFSSEYKTFDNLYLGSSEGYQVIPTGKTEEILSNIEKELTSAIENNANYDKQIQDETDSEYSRLNIINTVGILPTIENVFKTIMCHVETFMYMMYKCKENIDTQITSGLRTPEKLGIAGYTFKDYKKPENTKDENIGIPPWVAVSVEEKKGNTGIKENDYVNTVGWVGDFEGEVDWEEARLIDGLSLGVFRMYSEAKAPNETYLANASVYCLPTDVFSGLYPEGAINTPRRLGQYLSMRAAAMFGVMGYKQNAAEALGKADALNFLLKVGQEHIKSQFAKLPGDWHSEIKNSANEKVTGETDMTQIAYGSQPGSESPTPSIFTDTNNGKYRYAYTEVITNRQPNKPLGDKQYGMVYIPTQEERLTLGSFENNAPFVSTIVPMRRGDAEVPYRNVKANLQKDDKITRIYHKCSTDTFLHINQIGEENLITESDYDNEAMFNIFGGSKFMDTAEKIREEYGKLEADIFTVDNYKDTDTTWRKALKDYWNITDDTYLTNGITPENRYRLIDKYKDSSSFIFQNRFLYNQNNLANRSVDIIEASKCILFLSTAGYDIKRVAELFAKVQKKYIYESVPYGAVVLLGGLLWRAEQDNDCVLWLSNSKGQPTSDYTHKTNTTISYEFDDVNNGTGEKTYIKMKNYSKFSYVLNADWDSPRFKLDLSYFDTNVKNKLVSEFKNYLKNPEGWIHMQSYEMKTGSEGKQLYNANTFQTTYSNIIKDEDGKEALENEIERFYNDEYVKRLDEHVIVSFGSLSKPDDVNPEVVFDKSCWDSYVEAFCAKLEEIAAYQPAFESDIPREERNKEKDLKKAMYIYIKRIWDRWLMMSSFDKFKVQNYMKNFVFMDSFYRNIGTLLHINCEKLCEGLENVNGESMLWQLISKITTDHHCMFFALPDYFGFGDDNNEQENTINKGLSPEEKIKDLFTPIPFSKKEAMETSNKYIVMLVYDHNENLAHINDYTDDGFDIYSHDGNNVLPETFNVLPYSEDLALPDVPSEERRVRRYGYNIPSFGVTFGRMNNHLFKSVNVGMTNPIATEQSINALSLLASKGGSNDKKVCFYGQDLFPVYNGYSYDCTVEMMGNVQIMPLMYFQLLNMPMFRGTYMIYSVTHTMRPGDMTTTFKGMKLSRFAEPFANDWFITSRDEGNGFTLDSGGNLVSVDECVDYGNGEYKLRTGKKEVLISGGRGITRNPYYDKYELLHSWQTTINVRVHTTELGANNNYTTQGERTITLEVNKWLADDIKDIFNRIFNLIMGDKYFAVKTCGCYSDWPPQKASEHKGEMRRLVHDKKGSTSLSYHAYGVAIDLNWDENPNRPAKSDDINNHENDWLHIRNGHPIIQIFKDKGWGWGGSYTDYMHFSLFDGR